MRIVAIILLFLLIACREQEPDPQQQATQLHAQRMDSIRRHIESGDTSKAQSALTEAFNAGYQHPMAFFLQGRIHMASHTKSGAAASIPWFEKAINASPNWNEARLYLAQACIRDNRLQRAEQLFSEINTISPHSPVGPYGLALIDSTNGLTEACIEHLEEAFKRDHQYGPALLLRAKMAAKQNQISLQRKYYERYIHIDPLHAGAHFALGDVAQRQGRLGDAQRSFERSYELIPDPATAKRLAEIAAAHNDEATRQKWLERAGVGNKENNNVNLPK